MERAYLGLVTLALNNPLFLRKIDHVDTSWLLISTCRSPIFSLRSLFHLCLVFIR
jgi:hypothetical protein